MRFLEFYLSDLTFKFDDALDSFLGQIRNTKNLSTINTQPRSVFFPSFSFLRFPFDGHDHHYPLPILSTLCCVLKY